jgi:signal transduction histidine kinase
MTENREHNSNQIEVFRRWEQVDSRLHDPNQSDIFTRWGETVTPPTDSQQWNRVVDALGVIAALIRERTPAQELYAALAAGAATSVGADMALLRIADLETRTLETRAVHGFDHALRQQLSGRSSSLYDSQRVLASPRSSVFAFDVEVPVGFTTAEYWELKHRGIAHVLTVPLLNQGTLIGRLDLMSAGANPFSEQERTVSEALGAIIASALSDVDNPTPESESRLATARLNPPSFEGISDAREMFQYLVQWIDEMLGTRQCYGFTWHEAKGAFSPVAVSGGRPVAVQALKQIQLRPERVPALREAIHSQTPYVIPDASETALFPPQMTRALDLQNVMILPLRGSSGQLVGTIILDFPLKREHSDAFLNIASQAANYASIMLENALLYEAVQRSSENLAIVNEIGIELASLSDLDSLFRLVFYHIRSVMETTCFAVGLILPDRDNVEYRYAIENQIAEGPVVLPLGRDALSTVITSRRAQVAVDSQTIRRGNWFPLAKHGHVVKSAIAVPVVVGRETIGVMTAQSESAGAYEKDSLDLLTTVGMQLGAAIQNARLYAMVRARGERRGYLLDQIISQQEAERKMLVDDIHDHTLQTLAQCLFQLDMTSRRTGELSVEEASKEINKVRDTLSDNIDRLRETIFQLRPSTLDILGLEPATREYFKHFERDTGIKAELEIGLPERLDGETETKVYRFIQEAVDSIRHRSEVTRILVRVRQYKNDIMVTIADDGYGVDSSALATDHPFTPSTYSDADTRLLTLRERAELAGGKLEVTQMTAGGAIIQVVIPHRDGAL